MGKYNRITHQQLSSYKEFSTESMPNEEHDRTSRILLIGAVLSANHWHAGRPMNDDEICLMREELDILIDEEIAALEAATERRGKRRETYKERLKI